MDSLDLHMFRENADITKGTNKHPDVYDVTMKSNFFIGMDPNKEIPVITDQNPLKAGLTDIHRCVYLPSVYCPNSEVQVSIYKILTSRKKIH